MSKYEVVKDTREQQGWNFIPSLNCAGMVVSTLKTGDYSLKGLEEIFIIERKGSCGEFATNVFQKRFFRELDRMEDFAHAYLILEFDFDTLKRFPEGSGIPRSRWKYLKVSANLLLRKYAEIELKYKTKVIFAPFNGKERASLLFKYVSELYNGK